MKKLFSYGVLLTATALMFGSANQAQAMSIFNNFGHRHTFYITSEWATHDHRGVSQMQNLADFFGGERKGFRSDSVNLEVFYVGGIQQCDLPTGAGGGWNSFGSSGFAANGSGSRHVSSHRGASGGPVGSQTEGDAISFNWDRQHHDLDVNPPLILGGNIPGCPTQPRDYDDGPAPVPEPATMLLVGSGLAFLAGRRLRRKQLKH